MGMDNWGWLGELAWHERRLAGAWARCKGMLKSLDFILWVLGFLIRRVMQFSLPNCVLIVHSLKIKKVLITNCSKKCQGYKI